MKKVNVASYQIGLLFKGKELVKILREGVYWVWSTRKIELLTKTAEVKSSVITLDLLLRNETLAAMVDVIDVKDGELVLLFEKGIFQAVLTAGQYAYWKGQLDRAFERVDFSKVTIEATINSAVLENVKLKSYVRKLTVANQHKGMLFLDGKLSTILDAGTYYYWNNAISMEVKMVDTRIQQMEVSGQELLSRDKASLRINFYIRYEVVDIMKAVIENKEYDKQLYILVQLALREFVGAMTLDELLIRKSEVGTAMTGLLSEKATSLGVQIIDAGIRDVILTGEMKEIMNQVLIAEKKAQAKIIMRREETASTRSMLNTAKMMEENTMLWKLKEMEYIERIADKIGAISLSGNSNIIGQLKDIFVK
ncbi:slipin family protein [Arachidicoccus terrestris]|uniref:slipin family protein n=1 Tax=Arachidicoccus terrestris TaxID=2875539 RepID=UPI001CC521ED|nr:slipin family protein [Arachidicoccus terrestris]UAY56978.1 slipin family protein [Arachidicoccus terrestris]